MLDDEEFKSLSIFKLQEKEYSAPKIVGIVIAAILSIPIIFMLIIFVWQILIEIGLDVAPR